MKILLQYQGGRACPRLPRGELKAYHPIEIGFAHHPYGTPFTGSRLVIDGREQGLAFGDDLHIAFVRLLAELTEVECPGCGRKIFSDWWSAFEHLSGDFVRGVSCCHAWVWLDHLLEPWFHDDKFGTKYLPPGGRYHVEPRRRREWEEMEKDAWGHQLKLPLRA